MDPATISLLASTGGNLVSGLGSFIGGQAQARAAREASRRFNENMQKGIDFQSGIYDTAKTQYDPFIKAGTRGVSEYEKAISDYTQPTLDYKQKDFNLTNWKDPGYDFRMSEAQKAIDAGAASKGMTLGSGALKSMQQRGQDMASQEYANAYDRWLKDSQLRYGQASDQYGRDINFKNQNIKNWGDLSVLGQDSISKLLAGGNVAASNIMQGFGAMGQTQAGAAQASGEANAGGWNALGKGLGAFGTDFATWYKNRGKSDSGKSDSGKSDTAGEK